MLFLSDPKKKAQEQLELTRELASTVGLQINVGKTKQFIININDPKPLKVGAEDIEIVKDFKYLGSLVASSENDFMHRKSLAWGAFWKMESIWRSTSTETWLKVRIYQASVLSILLYGSETWILSHSLLKALDVFCMSCYRIMTGVKRLDHVTNKHVYSTVKQNPLSTTVARRQLRWVGHMLRRDVSEPINKYALYEPPDHLGSKKCGRQPLSFVSQVAKLISNNFQLSANEISKAAQDRKEWRRLVTACVPEIT